MDLPLLRSSMEAPRQPYLFLTLISLPLRLPLPYIPICKPCSRCNKKYGNPYLPHTVQTTLFPVLIPSRLEIWCWYGDIRPRWKGTYTVLLTTLTALKVDGIATWIHASHIKAAPDRDHEEMLEPRWRLHRTRNPLKLRFSHL